MKDDILSIIKDTGEILLDSQLNQGILKEIPIVSTMISVWNVGNSISDKLLATKIKSFLFELNSLDKSKISEFVARYEHDKDFNTRMSTKLVFILDKCDNEEKSRLIGKLFIAFILGKMDEHDFYSASKALNQITISDLEWFLDSLNFEIEDCGTLISAGLVYFELIKEELTYDSTSPTKLNTDITRLGKKIKEILKT